MSAAEPAGGSVPDEAHSTKVGTAYVLLIREKLSSNDTSAVANFWRDIGTVTARSAEAAVRQHAENLKSPEPVVLVAIPARSWQPVKVTPRVETSFVVEEVKP